MRLSRGHFPEVRVPNFDFSIESFCERIRPGAIRRTSSRLRITSENMLFPYMTIPVFCCWLKRGWAVDNMRENRLEFVLTK